MVRMKQIFLSFVLLCVASITKAQTIPDKVSYDFGDIFSHSERYVDFYFKNLGSKKSFFLRLDKQPELTYFVSSSTILPDSSIAIRFHVSPTKKGKFLIEIPLYFSDLLEPINVSLVGNMIDLPVNQASAFQSCPDFTQKPGDGNPLDFTLTVTTVDRETGQLLAKSTVAVIQNGLVLGEWLTNKQGQIVKRTPLGYTYFYATHPGYVPAELGAYVNFRRNQVVIALERKETKPIENDVAINIPLDDELELQDSPIEIVETPTIGLEIEDEYVSDISLPVLANIPLENFDSLLFKPNNIVFVLDVSTSMRAGDRFELMKYALYQLMEYIRPHDHIALVTYGSDARIVLKTTRGSEKERMIDEVKKLKASGFTAGGKGIKLGYELARKGYIEGGNNQVIIITDGAFNRDSDDYDRTVKRYTKEGYVLSVVGIKNSNPDENKMRQVAQEGNGRYVPIFKLADAQWNLIHEIRLASYRGEE